MGAGCRLGLVTMLVGLLVAAVAAQEGPAEFVVRPHVRDGWLVLDVCCGELFTPRSLSTLQSGLPAVVRVDVRVQRQAKARSLMGGSSGFEDVAQAQLMQSLTYDVWDERYVLRAPAVTRSYPGLDEALAAFHCFAAAPLVAAVQLRAELAHRVRVRAALVAVSPAQGEDLAAWLREAGSTGPGGGGGTFELGVRDLLDLVWERRPADGEASRWHESEVFRLGADGEVQP